jgi:hypothetical protein
MGVHVTFDSATKIIQLLDAPSGGFATLDAQIDLYSDAKEDWLNDALLNKFLFPFRHTFGGQDIGGGKTAGAYYILDNVAGWRVRPYDDDHELTISGNLFGLNPALPIFVPTVSPFTVLVRLDSSSLTQQAGIGATQQNIRDAMDTPTTGGKPSIDVKLDNTFAVAAAQL